MFFVTENVLQVFLSSFPRCYHFRNVRRHIPEKVYMNDTWTAIGPLGVLPIYKLCGFNGFYHDKHYCSNREKYAPFVKYIFKLDEVLRLNLTFQYVLFGRTCVYGYVLIKSAFPSAFCGLFSKFSVYPSSRQTTISLIVVKSTQCFSGDTFHPSAIIDDRSDYLQGAITMSGNFIVSMAYSVSDFKRISSNYHFRNSARSKDVVSFPWHLGVSNVNFQVVFLRAKSLHYLMISTDKTSPNLVKIFDGPGFKCPQITGKIENAKKMFKASAFQAVLFYSCYYCSRFHRYKIKYQTSEQKNVFAVKITGNKQFHLPSYCASQELCIFKFLADPSLKLNGSLTNFTRVGSSSMRKCTYAGVEVFEPGYGHRITECTQEHLGREEVWRNNTFVTSHHISTYPNKNDTREFFSMQNELTIVLYAFPEYAQMTVSVAIQSTKCKVFTFDECPKKHSWTQHVFTRQFGHLFTKIVQNRISQNHLMFLNFATETCFLIQLTRTTMTSRSCEINLYASKYFSEPGKEVIVDGRGVFATGLYLHLCFN